MAGFGYAEWPTATAVRTVGDRTMESRMNFTISCPCGKDVTVTATDAGVEVRCHCGNVNTVPSLSELRRAAGQSRYNQGIVDRVKQNVADRVLPSESACVKCGVPTGGVLYLTVECERTYRSGGGFWKHFFLFLLAPIWIWGQLRRDYSTEVFGRETFLDVPLLICPSCEMAIRKSRLARARKALLKKVPLYAELLREYPQATVSVSNKNG